MLFVQEHVFTPATLDPALSLRVMRIFRRRIRLAVLRINFREEAVQASAPFMQAAALLHE